ncbi:hypothetical protein TrRE_jg5234, partial [Triparma retinervis]
PEKPPTPPPLPPSSSDDLIDLSTEELTFTPVTPPPIYNLTQAELSSLSDARRKLTAESFGKILANLVLDTSPATFSSIFTPAPIPSNEDIPPTLPDPPTTPVVNENDMFPVLLSAISEASLTHAVHDMLKHYTASEHRVALNATWKGCGGRLKFLEKIATTLVRMLTCVYSKGATKKAYELEVEGGDRRFKAWKRKMATKTRKKKEEKERKKGGGEKKPKEGGGPTKKKMGRPKKAK